MYIKQEWKDHITEYPNRYRVTNNGDGLKTYTPYFGTVIQEGSPINAQRLNHMESGIESGHEQILNARVDFKSIDFDILALAAEVEMLKRTEVGSIGSEMDLETFIDISDITILSGVWDKDNQCIRG